MFVYVYDMNIMDRILKNMWNRLSEKFVFKINCLKWIGKKFVWRRFSIFGGKKGLF